MLIAAGADVNAANDLAIAPLYLASVNGNAAIARLLLDKGARVDAASETGVTPLMEAARVGSVDTVRLLLDRGANVNRWSGPPADRADVGSRAESIRTS